MSVLAKVVHSLNKRIATKRCEACERPLNGQYTLVPTKIHGTLALCGRCEVAVNARGGRIAGLKDA